MNTTGNSKRSLILAGLLLATFLSAIEGTVIGPAGPTIVSELGSVQLLSWIFTAYLLTMAVSTPIFGKISDLYGRKPVFLIGCALFILGSLLCSFSQNMEMLIVFRAIQGIGAGAVVPVTFTIIGDIYPIEERGKIQGWISSVWGISSLAGPLLGGYFVDNLGWQWIFGFNVPFGLLAMWFVFRYLHENVSPRTAKIDVMGALTFTVGITALLFVLSAGGQYYAWSSPLILGLSAVAVAFIVLFFMVEKRAEAPMVPLHLFRIQDIRVANIAGLLTSSLMIGLTSYLPLWVQGVRGGNATESGLLLAPMSVGWLIGSVWAGRLLMKIGSRMTSLIGLTGILIGSGGLFLVGGSSPQYVLFVLTFIYGLGFGFAFTIFTIIAQSSVGYRERGSSTALHTFMRTLGQTIGAAAFGTWLNYRISTLSSAQNLAAAGISDRDLNELLAPHTETVLSDDQWRLLRSVLEGSLHSLFIIMFVIAIVSWVATLALRKRLMVPEDADAPQQVQGSVQVAGVKKEKK
ncbi:MDR family MFS transporter [Paenibacillus tundrae]